MEHPSLTKLSQDMVKWKVLPAGGLNPALLNTLTITWLPRSLYLSPADFFYGIFLKRLFKNRTLKTLKAVIVTEYLQVFHGILFVTIENFVKRLNLVIKYNGNPIEI